MQLNPKTYQITDEGNFGQRALVVGIVGLVLSVAGSFLNQQHFFHSYLTAVVFWLGLGLGGLFFTMLHHLTGARWSVVLRRFSENFMSALPVLAILFIPVFFGLNDLYHWTHPAGSEHQELLEHKSLFLNTPGFIIRSTIYFVVWIGFAWLLYNASIRQDAGDSMMDRFKTISAPGMLLFALTITFASFDWLMSLMASWYSTIFGVYLFAGSLLAILAIITIMSIHLQGRGMLRDTVTVEHYHDLGKLMFGFTVFWAYIAFSQFMLIWYGNIPEETVFYRIRWEDGSWRLVSMIILVGHFAIPFIVLLTRAAKRNLKVLKAVSYWILLMHFVDMYWLVFPNLYDTVHLSWIDLTTITGVGGIFLWYVWRKIVAQPLIPVEDPNLQASIKFINQ